MFGCASFDTTDIDQLALPLSFLHHTAKADGNFCAKALPRLAVSMDRLQSELINPKLALQSLPPLIKGYLRVGAKIGEGAVIDHQFGTTDVLVILPVADINPRYIDYYGAEATRYAA
jgi:putative hemolysin